MVALLSHRAAAAAAASRPAQLDWEEEKKQIKLHKQQTRIDNDLNWTGAAAAAVEIVQKSTGIILFTNDDTGEGLWHVIQRDNNRQQQQQ